MDAPNFALVRPLAEMYVTEGWGMAREGRLHGGIDCRAAVGTSVYAASSGMVLFAGQYQDGSGGAVELEHGDGMITRYLHLSKVQIQTGSRATAAQQIGESGFAKSPHLHFDAWILPRYAPAYVAAFGSPKGPLGGAGLTKVWHGVTYWKVPAEPLVAATYQDDVVAAARAYGVTLSGGARVAGPDGAPGAQSSFVAADLTGALKGARLAVF